MAVFTVGCKKQLSVPRRPLKTEIEKLLALLLTVKTFILYLILRLPSRLFLGFSTQLLGNSKAHDSKSGLLGLLICVVKANALFKKPL